MESEAYAAINKQWKSTCTILLGGEVGELGGFSGWLSSHMRANRLRKSSLSGKETAFGEMPYPDGARAASFDEIDFMRKCEPLRLNQIKDIDSLVEALGERVCYTGNIVLGNTSFSEKSTHVVDSSYVYCSDEVFSSKYVAYTTHCVYADKCFGSCGFSGAVGICSNTFLCNRTLEVSKVDYSSDIYFSHGLSGCQDCMFCFNLKNRRNSIGNLALEKGKYLALKAKLLEEMRAELEDKKRLPRLEEMAASRKPDYSDIRASSRGKSKAQAQDMAPMENAYSKACDIVLGKRMGRLQEGWEWLSRNGATFTEAKSCASESRLIVPGKYAWFRLLPKDRLVALEEADAAGEILALGEDEVSSLSLSSAPAKIARIAFFCPVWQVGTNKNTVDCPTSMDSANCFRCEINIGAKNCAYTFWPRDSDSVIGSFACKASAHSLKCYLSQNLQRCFEVDASRNCSGCYFCHNCENVHDSMFCFNAKNLRYAIGNAEVGKEAFERAKKLLLSEITSSLEKTGDYKRSIYDIAPQKKAR